MADAPLTPGRAPVPRSELSTINSTPRGQIDPNARDFVAFHTRSAPAAAREARRGIMDSSPAEDGFDADAIDAAGNDDEASDDNGPDVAPEALDEASAAREEPQQLEEAAAPPATAKKRPAVGKQRAADAKKPRRTGDRPRDRARDRKCGPPKLKKQRTGSPSS